MKITILDDKKHFNLQDDLWGMEGSVFENCRFSSGWYSDPSNLAISIISEEGPYSHVTVNVDFQLPDNVIVIKNYDYSKGTFDALAEVGLLEKKPLKKFDIGYPGTECIMAKLTQKFLDMLY